MGGHSQIGARRLLHLLVVHHEELLLEITSERWWVTSRSLGGVFYFFIAMSLAISVLGFALTALDTSFSTDSKVVLANHKKLCPKAWRERWAVAGRALRVWLMWQNHPK